jgi:hypothetical protein
MVYLVGRPLFVHEQHPRPGEQYIGTSYQSATIPSGGTYWLTNTARVPVVQSGTYYLLVQANANDFLRESVSNNNVLAVPVSFNILPPDLAPVALKLPTIGTSAPNPRFTLVWGVTNQGVGPAEGYWNDFCVPFNQRHV